MSYLGDQSPWTLSLQAKTSQANSPLHAQALSLFLGLHVIISLQVHECDFLADNSELITCMKEQAVTSDWRIKYIIKDMKEFFKNIRGNFNYIPSEQNFIADGLARSATCVGSDSPNFNCSNISHCGACPLKEKTL